MMKNQIVLTGCSVEPLSSYLKALGVLRIVGEQADTDVRGFWQEDKFVIQTHLSKDELIAFFLLDYSPTPIVAPWNGGSGFYQGDEKKGFNALRMSSLKRFQNFKEVINEIVSWPEMPKDFDKLVEITGVLASEIESTREGKKREELRALLNAINQAISDTALLLESPVDAETALSEIESLSGRFKGTEKKLVASLWNAVKKGRTKCVSMERSAGKEKLLLLARSRLPEISLSWLDAVSVLRVNDKPIYNPVMGTGGNEGRLDFTNNFMQRVAELFLDHPPEEAGKLLKSSLFDTPVSGLWSAAIGQYDPGRAGGFNQGAEVETKNFKINPWDFILMMEGMPLFSGAIAKRNDSDAHGWGALPFTVQYSGVGFSSSEQAELGRAETWLPIWKNPASFKEVRQLFGEAKAAVGKRPANTGIDFARCVSTLGVDRGIDGFIRYAFLERRGTNYVALPAGRHAVTYDASLRILDDLDPMLYQVDGFLRQFKNVPATFMSARRGIDEAIYECAVASSTEKFISLVRAIGKLERIIALRDRSKDPKLNHPITGLSPRWITVCDNGTSEIRIAAALASIYGTKEIGPLRSNLSGVDPSMPWKWASGNGCKSWVGNTLSERMLSAFERRLMDAERFSEQLCPVRASLPIRSCDLVSFLLGDTDDSCIEDLLWGFSLIRWSREDVESVRSHWTERFGSEPIPRDWAILKLLFHPGTVRKVTLPKESRILSLLRAERIEEAVGLAVKRLRNSGLNPLPVIGEDWTNPKRLAAGLMIPVLDIAYLESLVLKTNDQTK